jgi:DNA polymerase-3 subunit delta'
MRDVVGQERVINWLQAASKQNRLAHAYLFTDGERMERKKLAVQLAKTLNCEQKGQDACDACSTCLQIEHGNHPEIVSIQPEGSYIKIDQVRSMQATFRYRAPDHVRRVLIIESAERMRLETANSLLKFLEEPISPMIAILLTEKKERILPTIQSRCQWVRFAPSVPIVFQNMFMEKGYREATANLLANLRTKGDWMELESNIVEEKLTNLVQWSFRLLTREESALLDVQFGWISDEVEQGRASSLLEILLIWLKEVLKNEHRLFLNYQDISAKIRARAKEENILLAIENVLIASRLVQRAELSASAIWEQMVIATQDNKISKPNDWRMIVI